MVYFDSLIEDIIFLIVMTFIILGSIFFLTNIVDWIINVFDNFFNGVCVPIELMRCA